jgi:Cu/Ag efflux pump CusA
LLEARLGSDLAREQALQDALPQYYVDAVTEHDVDAIAPPEILLQASYPGADALTLEGSVATPIEQQMSGVDNMIYMYSTNMASGSQTQLRVDFDVTTNPSTDQVLANLRYSQAASQLPPEVVSQGVTVKKSTTSPLALFVLTSPKGTYDQLFLSNYAYVNINDPMTRVPGIGQVQIFGSGPYAMRFWARPDLLAKLEITVNDIVNAIQAQVTGPVSALAATDPLRVQFDRLHGISNILYSITALGGLALCFWEAREIAPHPTTRPSPAAGEDS